MSAASIMAAPYVATAEGVWGFALCMVVVAFLVGFGIGLLARRRRIDWQERDWQERDWPQPDWPTHGSRHP